MGCVQSRGLGACVPHLPGFILLVSSSDTLLVVSILDIVYDCHFAILMGLLMVSVGAMGPC